MKMGRWAGVVLAALLLAGCANFWQAPTTTTTTTTTTTLSSGYFYLLDTGTSDIVSYSIVSGALTLVGSYPMPATIVASSPNAIAVSPNGEFLFVSTISGIYVYTVSSGVLTLGNAGGIVVGDPATAMVVDSTSSWLLESSGSGTLNAIPVSSTTGTFGNSVSTTIQQVALTATSVNQLALASNNGYVFAALGANGTEEFAFNASNSTPLAAAPANTIKLTGTSSLSVAVDPSDRLVYVGETAATSGSDSGGLRAFTFNPIANTLSEIGSAVSSGGVGPYSILPKSSGDYVYVANWTGESSAGNITGFQVTASGSAYKLTNINTIATGIRPSAIVEDNLDHFVLAANAGGSPYLNAYIFDTTTAGKLDLTLTSVAYEATGVAAQ